MRRVIVAGSALGGVAAVAHAAPALLSQRPIRMRFAPALAGVGRADHVALTFDDGPDPASTPQFIDELDRLGWKATFFLLGCMVRQAPSVAADLVAAGHEVAVHGDSHRSQLVRAYWGCRDDVCRARDSIASATGVEPVWFRPPYGTMSGPSVLAARAAKLRTVLWTAWGRDWRPAATPDSVLRDVMHQLDSGGTILLHDSDCTSAPGSWKTTLAALPLLAEAIEGRGWTVGPLRDHGVGAASAESPPARPARPGATMVG
jgi:peptidoglycan/xylan/chitin deacetylase (PgdA/CDA1 family)